MHLSRALFRPPEAETFICPGIERKRPDMEFDWLLGWSDRKAARASLQRILQWDFARVILAHGDLIESDARRIVEKAWEKPLAGD